MYKYIKVFIVISILIVIFNTNNMLIYANEQEFYAQIQNDNVFIFEDKGTKPLFEIPNTFYVKLLEDEQNGFYRAQYMNIIGYIQASAIQCVEFPPATPYLVDVNFRILASQSAELRREASRQKGLSTLICELPLYETNFKYYGKLEGEEVVPQKSNIWYYASYTKNSVTEYGYIYSGLIDNMSKIEKNTLSICPIPKHDWSILKTPEPQTPAFEPPTTSQLAIILAIIIPALLLILILFKSNSKSPSPSKNSADIIKMPSPNTPIAVPIKRKKGKDYYELE